MRELVKTFKALSDDTRLRILNVLMERECCVCEVMQALDISQARASRNLSALYDAGFLKLRRNGLWALYSVDEKNLEQHCIDLVASVRRALEGNETALLDRQRLKNAKRTVPGIVLESGSEVKTTKDTISTERQLVLFTLGDESYGVDISIVHEIIEMQHITAFPGMSTFVEGIINIRNNVAPVIDMRKRLGLITIERTRDTRIIVVDIAGRKVGMVVDMVTGVKRIPADAIEPPSGIITTYDLDYMLGIAKLDDEIIILLNLDRVLPEEMGFLSNMSSREA